MRYLGGKAKIARYVTDVVCAELRPGQAVWEPFCGGLNVTAELGRRGVDVIATDASVPLMSLLCAVRDGWIPPASLSEAEYHAARALPATDPLHGFAGCCSWGGRVWAGYARAACMCGRSQCKCGGKPRNYANDLRSALIAEVSRAALLACVDFFAVEPASLDVLIYCDPPYAGQTGYGACAPFDHARFVERVRAWSRYCVVLVSEYDYPLGEVVFERERAAHLRGREATHVERIYRVGK